MRRPAIVLFALLAAFVVGACQSGNDDGVVGGGAANRATTTTASVAAPPSTTATAVTAPSGPVTTPDAAANGLFNAWQRADKADASHYARERAINAIFEHPADKVTPYKSQGCQAQGGQFICSWTYPGGVLQMTVEAVAGNTPAFVVDNVTYVAD